MKKSFIFLGLVLVLLSLNFVAAKDVEYKERLTITKHCVSDCISMTRVISAEYDNDDRFSTYDYRHGYSYRTSIDYWEKHHDNYVYLDDFDNDDCDYKNKRYSSNRNNCDRDDCSHRGYREYGRDYVTEYVPYLKQVEKRNCYDSPPAGKIFYIKC